MELHVLQSKLLKRGLYRGRIKEDTRSLDYSSHEIYIGLLHRYPPFNCPPAGFLGLSGPLLRFHVSFGHGK